MFTSFKNYVHIISNVYIVRKYSKISAMSLLRGWKNNEPLKRPVLKPQKFDYFLVLDFEATCDNQVMMPAQVTTKIGLFYLIFSFKIL